MRVKRDVGSSATCGGSSRRLSSRKRCSQTYIVHRLIGDWHSLFRGQPWVVEHVLRAKRRLSNIITIEEGNVNVSRNTHEISGVIPPLSLLKFHPFRHCIVVFPASFPAVLRKFPPKGGFDFEARLS